MLDAISNKGQTAGYYRAACCFIRKADGTIISLEYPGTETEIERINDLGQVVGGSNKAFFSATTGGKFTNSGPAVPGAPSGINHSGQIVGT